MALPSIVILTGAGISAESGVETFRDRDGIWSKVDVAEVATPQGFAANPAKVHAFYNARRAGLAGIKPNPAHAALAKLEKRHKGDFLLVTQNIDRLHHRAGSSPDLVLELHGNLVEATCWGCGGRSTTAEALARVEAGEDDPRCLDCGGILKTATVMFGQQLDPDVLDAAVAAARDAEVFVAVGSTLRVHPAAGLCDVALAGGAELVVVNGSETDYDAKAHRVIRAPIGEALPALVDELTG